MLELINAKAAAQRAVFDREALYRSVEQVMADAVSAELQVAQAVVSLQRQPELEPVSPLQREQTAAPEELQAPVRALTMFDLFRRHGSQSDKRTPRKSQPIAPQQLSLFPAQTQ